MIDKIEDYIEAHRERFVALLHEFLRIPSISTDASQTEAMGQAARWVRQRLAFTAKTMSSGVRVRHPWKVAGRGRR